MSFYQVETESGDLPIIDWIVTAITITIRHPTKFNHKKGKFIISYLSNKNNAITRTWVIKAATKTEFPFTALTKNANKKINSKAYRLHNFALKEDNVVDL